MAVTWKLINMERKMNEHESEPLKGEIVDVTTSDSNEGKLRLWHSYSAQFAESKEIMHEKKQAVILQMKAQHEALKLQLAAGLDLSQKRTLEAYLEEVSDIESSINKKMVKIDQEQADYEEVTRDDIYSFYDQARNRAEKWKNIPERHKVEVERLNEMQAERLDDVKRRLKQLKVKREKILDQTVKVFETEFTADSIKKKFGFT